MRTPPSRQTEAPRSQAVDGGTPAWLDDLHLWKLEVGRHGRDGPKTYTYWMASWREDGRMRNVYLGSTRKLDAEAALQKASEVKRKSLEALGMRA